MERELGLIISFLKIQFFSLDRIKIHPVIKIIAIIAFSEEFTKESISPKPVIESGPRNRIAIPPPSNIRNPH